MREPDGVDFRVDEPNTSRPKNTCPDINSALSDLKSVTDILEILREKNSELRDNATEWEEIAKKYHAQALEWERYAHSLETE